MQPQGEIPLYAPPTKTTEAPNEVSKKPIPISLIITFARIDASRLSLETSSALLLAVKEAVAVESGKDISADMVTASQLPLAADGSELPRDELTVSAELLAEDGRVAESIYQTLSTSGSLKQTIASWVSWAQGVSLFAPGIRVKSVTISGLPQHDEQRLTEAGRYGQIVGDEPHTSPLVWVFYASAVIICCGCLHITLQRKKTQSRGHQSHDLERLSGQADLEVCSRIDASANDGGGGARENIIPLGESTGSPARVVSLCTPTNSQQYVPLE